MISATPVILPTRKPVDATWHRAASVTIRNPIAKPQVTASPSESASVMRNTAGANVSRAQIVTAIPRDCRRNDRLALLEHWNTFPTETTRARPVTMEGVPSEAISILRIAAGVTRARASEWGTEVSSDHCVLALADLTAEFAEEFAEERRGKFTSAASAKSSVPSAVNIRVQETGAAMNAISLTTLRAHS
jgi:hypothetical protein